MPSPRDSLINSFHRLRGSTADVDIRHRNTLAKLNARSAVARAQLDAAEAAREQSSKAIAAVESDLEAMRATLKTIIRA